MTITGNHVTTLTARRIITRMALVALGFIACLWCFGWLLRPHLPDNLRQPSAAGVKAAFTARDNRLPMDQPLRIYREVDYREGADAAWWPKGESPVLAELVREGRLPPVAERVGPEPLVYEGVGGIGNYGGTWTRVAGANQIRFYLVYEMGCATLSRWSPYGEATVPHLATRIDASADYKEFTVHLRKVRWSDGHPFTADDVMFWWKDWATWQDPQTGEALGMVPELVKIRGEYGRIEKIDDHTVRYIFPHPYGMFPEYMATMRAAAWAYFPAHFLRPYHPGYGDQELIERTMKAYNFRGKRELFDYMRCPSTPGRPTLGPWMLHTYRANGPYVLVRNPYYYAVDTAGNQLPYIDRILQLEKNPQMVPLSVAAGDASMEVAEFKDYTTLMSQRQNRGYDIYHWYNAGRSDFVIQPNLNLLIDPDNPATAKKAKLLADARFRKALSHALDREAIIDAVWHGVGEPSQVAPGKPSIYYYPKLNNAAIEYSPQRANRLLDDLGLTARDSDGFRTFPDGTRMTFFMNAPQGSVSTGPAQFVVRYWRNAGIRVILRERADSLFSLEIFTRTADFYIARDDGSHSAISSKYIVPQNGWSAWAGGWGNWYYSDGMSGSPAATAAKNIRPPENHPIMRAFELFDRALGAADPEERATLFEPAMEIAAENLWTISIATPPPVPAVVQNGLKGVPQHLLYGFLDFGGLNNAYPETWYWEEPMYAPGARAELKREITTVTTRADVAGRMPAPSTVKQSQSRSAAGRLLATLVRGSVVVLLAAAVLLVIFRHPFVGRRLLIMVPTLLIISVGVFIIIQIAPGNYIDTYIQELQMQGREASRAEIQSLREMFHMDDSMPVRYLRWMGGGWFTSFKPEDKGLLQGHLGWSMASRQPVNDIVGDRILLTLAVSLGTLLFTWIVALPIGIYSAVRQYSAGDYILTFLGFVGVCVPQFLLALILIYISDSAFGIQVTGLFSPEFASQAAWNWPKVLDLLKHIWLPIIVLGVAGTAGMIRVMRANLLDELKKPYVVTARAKGVRPLRLLLKYPVRIALNPFVSGIGAIFPTLVSGGAIVAMVMSLPTIGPLMLNAVLAQDTYLAGSLLMVLSLLGVVGVLVSDLLLMAIDPRIRMGRGEKGE